MSSPDVILKLSNIESYYGPIMAIRGISLEVPRGQIVTLLGANGAGKTTTILALSGELAPMSGEVRFRGDASRRSLATRARQGLALVTEEKSVFMRLTTAENLRLGRGGVDRALEIFPQLREHLNRRAGLLSGGQQQILTLARALAADPRILLADELSLGLAPIVVQQLFEVIRRAADERGVGVLLVEQHVRSALEVADRLYILQRGRCVLQGPAHELRESLDEIERSYLAGPVEAPD